MTTTPQAFLSYTRLDDQGHDGGITALRAALELQVRIVTGDDSFEIFQDVDAIAFGEHWPKRLDQALAASRFLIPVLSPRFFKSDPCRDELRKFLTHERDAGRNDLILPIYWVEANILERPQLTMADDLAAALAERQRWDWRSHALASLSSQTVRRAIRELARAIAGRLELEPVPRMEPVAPPIDRPAVPVALHTIKGAGVRRPATLAADAFTVLRDPATKEAEATPVDKGQAAIRAERKVRPPRTSQRDVSAAAQAAATAVSTVEKPQPAGQVDERPDTTRPEPSVETEEAVKAVTAPVTQDIAAKVVAEDRPQATLRSEEAPRPNAEPSPASLPVTGGSGEAMPSSPPAAEDMVWQAAEATPRRTGPPRRPYAAGDVFRDVDAPWCPEMVVIRAGTFTMGSPDTEEGSSPSEGPQRQVTFAQPFAMGRYTVTFEEWDACVTAGGCKGYRPGDHDWGRGRQPVINVSWEDAQGFVAWLALKTDQPYRLPTEAEWEYAARAGTATPFWTGETISTAQANYNGNYTYAAGAKGVFRETTVLVDDPAFPANPFGLHHVHGNVCEWVQDAYLDTYAEAPSDGSLAIDVEPKRRWWGFGTAMPERVACGGTCFARPEYLRSAFRGRFAPVDRSVYLGFRVARMLTP